MIDFSLSGTAQAPIETVFDVMTDHRAMASTVWACRRSSLDREGVPAPNGVGAVRRLVAVGPPFVEEIIEYDRPNRWAYRMLSGAPTEDHVGTIRLRRAESATEITWHLRARSKVPRSDWLMTPLAKLVIATLISSAVRAAEGRQPPSGASG